MSFNVRYPNPEDGPNFWDNRRDLVARMIEKYRPDVIGTQELFARQGNDIVERRPEYAWFGLSRRGDHEDEHMGIFYQPGKLRIRSSGQFWLSETPEVPASMSWDVSLPRMVSWAEFSFIADGGRFHFWNTHFPHRREDDAAREKAAKLIAERQQRIPREARFILTGDFNSNAGSPVYRTLTGPLADAWSKAPKREGPECTSNGSFSGRMEGPRIDWILYRGPLQPTYAETVLYQEEGRWASDHHPVVVDFRWGTGK